MTCKEVAKQLLRYPDADVLLKVGDLWCEVAGVVGTGQHRNAMTLSAVHPDLGGNVAGVIVVDNEMTPMNQS